ncbi:MAG: hypothetical protein L6275_00905 [Candidatus Portnoybacteria bacterium]|nr:hypothetical protein [Candidatus Portnoybacteria bacterium]
MRNLIRLGIVACLMFFLVSCASWKENIAADMKSDIKEADDAFAKKEKVESLVPVFELLDGGKMIKVTFEGSYLVPKNDTKAPPFEPSRIRLVSLFKERGGYKTKFFSEVKVANGTAVITIPNPALRFGEPFVDGWWGMGISVKNELGYLMINPDNNFTAYKTTIFNKADINTLLICPVFYKDKVRPLKEVLAEKKIKMDDFISANRWGYCPELK